MNKRQVKAAAKRAAKSFSQFLTDYDKFRETAGLAWVIDDEYEVCTSMTDKVGRICRHMKHIRRDDPKADWKTEVPESFVGLLLYALMVVEKYDVDIERAFLDEFMKACEQHGK